MLNLNSTLRYQTGTATFIQLAVVVLLVVLNNLIAMIAACTKGDDCAITALFSMVFIVMTGVWFMILSAIGYAAEERRSRNFAFILIAGQLATMGIAYGFMKHPSTWFGGLSAFFVIVVAAWVILLAWRLAQSRGSRIVAKPKHLPQHRPRQRLHTSIDEIDPHNSSDEKPHKSK